MASQHKHKFTLSGNSVISDVVEISSKRLMQDKKARKKNGGLKCHENSVGLSMKCTVTEQNVRFDGSEGDGGS